MALFSSLGVTIPQNVNVAVWVKKKRPHGLFSVSHNRLMQVSLCLPDENGIVVNEEVLLDEQSILRFVA